MDLNLQTLANLETISDMFEEGLKGLVLTTSIFNRTKILGADTDLISSRPTLLCLPQRVKFQNIKKEYKIYYTSGLKTGIASMKQPKKNRDSRR